MLFEKRYARVWIGAGLMIVLAGLIFEIIINSSGDNIAQPRQWPNTNGVVTSTNIRPVSVDGGTSVARRPIIVEYKYQVDGATYRGSQEINSDFTDPALQHMYFVGQQVTVYYNPDAHLQSLIDLSRYTNANAVEPVLSGPKNVLLFSAILASLPFFLIGIGLLLTGRNSRIVHYSHRGRSYRRNYRR